jgi:hypothetical protein
MGPLDETKLARSVAIHAAATPYQFLNGDLRTRG